MFSFLFFVSDSDNINILYVFIMFRAITFYPAPLKIPNLISLYLLLPPFRPSPPSPIPSTYHCNVLCIFEFFTAHCNTTSLPRQNINILKMKRCVIILGYFIRENITGKDLMQAKLFQRCTHLLYCSVLSLGGNVNTRRMLKPDMGSIFHINNR